MVNMLERLVFIDETRSAPRHAGTALSKLRRNFRNSPARWRGRHSPVTWPDLTSGAANSVAGRWRLSLWVTAEARPFFSGTPGRVRSSAWICDFLIHAQHDGPVRRVKIEPDDLGDLSLEHRIV